MCFATGMQFSNWIKTVSSAKAIITLLSTLKKKSLKIQDNRMAHGSMTCSSVEKLKKSEFSLHI